MFNSLKSILGFLVGLGLTMGLLLTPHLFPWGYRLGLGWPWVYTALLVAAGLGLLAGVLWLAGRLIQGAQSWKEGRVILAAVLIAVVANTLYSLMVELYGMGMGARALIAVLGVPVIYGNLGAVLGRQSLRKSMVSIFTGALTTMGAGFITVALIRGL